MALSIDARRGTRTGRPRVAVPGNVRRTGMSVFSEAEVAYLQSKTMGRLATIGVDGRPHLVPLTYCFNAAEDTIDIGGVDFGNTKKWRDMVHNPHVAFLVDDASPGGAHAIEIRGRRRATRQRWRVDQSQVSELHAAVRPSTTASHRELGNPNGRYLSVRPNRVLIAEAPKLRRERWTLPGCQDRLATHRADRPATRARPAHAARSSHRYAEDRRGSTSGAQAG
jgi:pyridoxamine 5'-phosphate oxidase family protein